MMTGKKSRLKRFKLEIFNFWTGNNRDRFLLFGIIAFVYLVIKILDELVPNKYLSNLPSDTTLLFLGVVIFVMTIHAIYIYIAQNHRRQKPRELNETYRPSVDIFISAHNEQNVISSTLSKLLELSYPDLKIYAINDRSTDHTQEMMEDVASGTSGKLIVVNRPNNAAPGKSAALNDAFKISSGEVICVLDADARIEDTFLYGMVAYLSDPQVAAVQAQKVISNPQYNALTRCQYHEYALDTYMQMGRDSIRGSVELRGNGEIITREALDDVGGWNEETLTDDLDLSTCLHVNGWDIRFSPENKVYEEGVTSIDGFMKQRRRWAEGSMRRYLNYFMQLMEPGNLSLVQIFDTFVFLSEFSIPLWVTLDFSYEVVKFALGYEFHTSFLMLMTFWFGAVMYFAQFNGLRIYQGQKVLPALVNSFVNILYFTVTWNTIIMLTYRKILFSRTVGTWTRTQHGVN